MHNKLVKQQLKSSIYAYIHTKARYFIAYDESWERVDIKHHTHSNKIPKQIYTAHKHITLIGSNML